MKLHTYAWSALLVLSVAPSIAVAGDVLIGVAGSKIGDLGNSSGVEVGYRFHPAVRARLGYSSFGFEQSRTLSLFSVTQKLEQENPRLTLDWFPWKSRNGFYASVGVTQLSEPSQITANVTQDLIKIEASDGKETEYGRADFGQVTGTVETNETLPYVGIGYVHHFGTPGGNGWYLQADVGQVFGLDPQLKLTTTDPNNRSTLAADLQHYADQQNKLFEDSYTIYGLTVGYRF